jgi:hypothetical protein
MGFTRSFSGEGEQRITRRGEGRASVDGHLGVDQLRHVVPFTVRIERTLPEAAVDLQPIPMCENDTREPN